MKSLLTVTINPSTLHAFLSYSSKLYLASKNRHITPSHNMCRPNVGIWSVDSEPVFPRADDRGPWSYHRTSCLGERKLGTTEEDGIFSMETGESSLVQECSSIEDQSGGASRPNNFYTYKWNWRTTQWTRKLYCLVVIKSWIYNTFCGCCEQLFVWFVCRLITELLVASKIFIEGDWMIKGCACRFCVKASSYRADLRHQKLSINQRMCSKIN